MTRTLLSPLLCLATVCAAADPDPSLRLWLPMDEGVGAITADQSPSGLEGELNGAGWAKGAFGQDKFVRACVATKQRNERESDRVKAKCSHGILRLRLRQPEVSTRVSALFIARCFRATVRQVEMLQAHD